MRKFFLLVFSIWVLNAAAQQPKQTPVKKPNISSQAPGKKYTSLLWEITGNGLQKPSYLFGTMHISDKLVFHLGDPFYNAIKSVDVVALETNPENWQDDYNESIFLKNRNSYGYGSMFMNFSSFAMNDKMKITSFAIDNNEEAIKAALAVEPSLVNGLLYRTYGSNMADFEEDTYLDMYIFQTGKKLGKKMAGVENFRESEKLVMEAYKDMYSDDKRKRRSYDFEDMFANPKKMEEAYRNGDLDALDSLDALEVVSEKFQEKFMYKRNEIQAKNIDSIVKKQSLFVAVGAAHLPGKRGVIEMLRDMGYSLRPIKIGEQNSRQKETIDKLRYKSSFLNQTSDDGFYNVSIPGKKFYTFTEWGGMDIKQFADMPNGSYYMVVRVKTNSNFQGQSTDVVLKKVDSLFYENIPGKILKKTPITKNGFKGWEIINRIRRGDYQRYNIFVTPFEIIVFKMSGNGEYIMNGTEASSFFNSIKLKEYTSSGWVNFQPPTGGFGVQLPYTASLLKNDNEDRLEYAAHDQQNSYLIMQSNFYPTSFVEEDTFDLRLMDESYAFSPFIDKQVSRKFYTQDGYPAMEAKYLHKDKSYSEAKFVIKGPVYYTAVVHYKNENDAAKKFLSSFSVKPFIYPTVKKRTDTAMHFTVNSPFFPEEKTDEEMEKLLTSMTMMRFSDEMEDEDMFGNIFGDYEYKMIGNDTLGEKVFVSYHKPGKYDFIKDSAKFGKNNFRDLVDEDDEEDSTFIYKLDKKYELPGGIKCREIHVTDTGSSRLVLTKFIYKNGHVFTLTAITDTLSKSPFLSTFFDSFSPADTLKGESLFTRKSKKFFEDYFSTDSVISKKAAKSLDQIRFDSLDVPLIKNAIERVNWKTRDYTSAKTSFIWELGKLKDSTITPYLKELYFKVKDTSDFQNAILSALLSQKTKASFITFKDLILQEPPIEAESNYYGYRNYGMPSIRRSYTLTIDMPYYSGRSSGGSWSELYDTLALTKNIFPDFLQLMNIEDYRDEVMGLLVTMVDSGYLKATDYETFFSKFYLDAKQALKKQVAKEENDNIEKESRKGKKKSFYDYDEDEDEEMDEGNKKLESYAILMLPFYDKNPGIPTFFEQLLKTRDRQLYYDICLLLLRNKKQVPDSFFTRYAKLDDYRCELYDDLKKIKMLEKYPAQYKTQGYFTKSMVLSNSYSYNYDKPDSLTYIDRLPVTIKNKKGWVYFYKYKEGRDDNFWQLCAVGMQPDKQDSVDTKNKDFTTSEGRKIANDKPLKEQMIKMLNELVNAQRSSASDFYDARRYDIYRNYLSDLVKRERFND